MLSRRLIGVHDGIGDPKLPRFGVEVHQGNIVHTRLVLDLVDSDSEERRLHRSRSSRRSGRGGRVQDTAA